MIVPVGFDAAAAGAAAAGAPVAPAAGAAALAVPGAAAGAEAGAVPAGAVAPGTAEEPGVPVETPGVTVEPPAEPPALLELEAAVEPPVVLEVWLPVVPGAPGVPGSVGPPPPPPQPPKSVPPSRTAAVMIAPKLERVGWFISGIRPGELGRMSAFAPELCTAEPGFPERGTLTGRARPPYVPEREREYRRRARGSGPVHIQPITKGTRCPTT